MHEVKGFVRIANVHSVSPNGKAGVVLDFVIHEAKGLVSISLGILLENLLIGQFQFGFPMIP